MGGHDRRRLMMLVAMIVIVAGALCLLHAHGDGLDLCAQVLVIGGIVVIAGVLPGERLVPVLAPALPFTVPELTAPPPRR